MYVSSIKAEFWLDFLAETSLPKIAYSAVMGWSDAHEQEQCTWLR